MKKEDFEKFESITQNLRLEDRCNGNDMSDVTVDEVKDPSTGSKFQWDKPNGKYREITENSGGRIYGQWKKLLLLVIFGLTTSLLTSCATPYQPNGFRGGYSEMQLSENAYRVNFHGNGMTSEDKVAKYFLRRCADLTVLNGYDYFIIQDSHSSIAQSTIQTESGKVQTQGSLNQDFTGQYNYQETKTYTPPQSTVVNKHTRNGVVVMFKEGSQPQQSLKANIVLSNFKD